MRLSDWHPCNECAQTSAFRRIARCCHPQHGRRRRKTRLGMDLHPGRTSHRRLRGGFVLHPLGLPGHCKVPERNRTWVLPQHVPDTMLNDVLPCIPGVWVVRKLQADMKYSAGGETFKMKYVWQCLTDRQTWLASESFPLPGMKCIINREFPSGDLHGLVSTSNALTVFASDSNAA